MDQNLVVFSIKNISKMSNLAVCRLCLAYNIDMHVIADTLLQEMYEKMTNLKLKTEDARPLMACYICYYQLKKCYQLMEKCLRSEQLLTQLINSSVQLTQKSISLINRKSYNLLGGLSISPIEWVTVAEDIDLKNNGTIQNITLVDNTGDLKWEKEELKDASETNTKIESDVDNTDLLICSDSEDDVPLKSISIKKSLDRRVKNLSEKRVRLLKKEDINGKGLKKGFKMDAREIILTKEQQLEDLIARSKSLNYITSPYKCDLCYKGFVDAKAYDNHKEKHDESSGAHECSVCRMRYRSARHLRTHAHTAHARHYACNKCSNVAHTANQARDHEKWHNGYTYECQLCGQKFRKPTSYLTHMRKRHPTEHICNICGENFVGRHGLLMHKSKAHKRDDKVPENSESSSKLFCVECNIQFFTMEAWKRHILSSVKHTLSNETSTQCQVCGLRFSGTSLLAHIREHDKTLRRTRRAARGDNTRLLCLEVACDQCGAYFVNRSKLQSHIRRVHLGEKYIKNVFCEVCGKKCTSNASLKYHQRTHTGERPYACNTCSKRFADNNQLRIHTRTHTGERPYCCAECGKRFSQKPALNRHYRVHTGVKPYTCQFCSKTFSQSNSMKLHVRTVHLKMPPNNRKNKAQNPAQDSESIEKK